MLAELETWIQERNNMKWNKSDDSDESAFLHSRPLVKIHISFRISICIGENAQLREKPHPR